MPPPKVKTIIRFIQPRPRPAGLGFLLKLPPKKFPAWVFLEKVRHGSPACAAGQVPAPTWRPGHLARGKFFLGSTVFNGKIPSMVHTGIGYDVHPLAENRKLVLGGVHIPFSKGLQGHSDADVLIHALCDAILGALGEGDIGCFFPNSDPRWKNAESRIFLEEAGRLVRARNGRIVNVDSTLIAEQPKVLPYREAMKENLARALGLETRQVGIKATTNEHLGFIGRGEGIAAMAVAAVDLP